MIRRPRYLVPWMLPALVLACAEPEAPGDTKIQPAFDHNPLHRLVNSLADPGVGGCTAAECTLREAIASVPAGGNITFSVTGNIALARASGGLILTRSVTITGPATLGGIVVNGGGFDFSVFTVIAGRTVNLSRLTVRGGARFDGGAGILNRGTLTLTSMRIIENLAEGTEGGGIWNDGGTLRIRNSLISSNESTNGGGISNSATGDLQIFNSTIAANVAIDGGGIINRGRLTLDRTTVSSNRVPGGAGGGIWNTSFGSGASAVITNSTISGNRGAAGAGVDVTGGHVILQNTTVAGNSAESFGGGLAISSGALELNNTLVANNILSDPSAVAPDLSYGGGTLVARFSLVRTAAGHPLVDGVAGNIIGATVAEVNLGPLAANGGSTRTHALRAGSIAIDAGQATGCPTIDQWGVHRPIGGGCDIGSYEYNTAIAFEGFFPPILNPPSLNPLSAGATVNLQFRLKGAQGLNILAPKSPLSQPINCSSKVPTGPDASTVSPTGTGLSYDSGKNLYTYPWLTRAQWKGTCRAFVLRLIDGTAYRAYFDFR